MRMTDNGIYISVNKILASTTIRDRNKRGEENLRETNVCVALP